MTEARWALPEESPAESVPPELPLGVAAMPAVGAAPPKAASPTPVLPVFERPLTVADIVDGGFQIIKARPRVMVGIAALFVVPVGVVVALADFGALGGDVIATLTDPDTFEQNSESGDADLSFTVISSLVTSAMVTLMAAPVARVVEAWYLGRELSAIRAVRGVGWGWLSIIVGWVLLHVLEAVGTAALVLPGIAIMALGVPLAPLIAVERIGPFAGLRRSFRLVRRRFWPVLWVALLSGLVAVTLTLMLPLLPLAIVSLVGFGGEQYVTGAATIAAALLTMPFIAATATVAYFDLRVRTEGLDLQLAVGDEFQVTT